MISDSHFVATATFKGMCALGVAVVVGDTSCEEEALEEEAVEKEKQQEGLYFTMLTSVVYTAIPSIEGSTTMLK